MNNNLISEPIIPYGTEISQKLINDAAYKVGSCAIEVHRQLGPGLLESVYHTCLLEELNRSGIKFRSEVKIPIVYRQKKLSQTFRVDLLVEDLIIVELKSVDTLISLYSAQLLTYMKLADMPKGLLINFNSEVLSKQIVSLVNENFFRYPKE